MARTAKPAHGTETPKLAFWMEGLAEPLRQHKTASRQPAVRMEGAGKPVQVDNRIAVGQALR